MAQLNWNLANVTQKSKVRVYKSMIDYKVHVFAIQRWATVKRITLDFNSN